MSDKPGRRSIEILLTIPWAIRPEWAKQMLTIARRDGLTPEAVAAELGQPLNNTRTVTVREGIATIPMSGPMFRYANIFADVSGATSYEALATDLRVALDDASVQAILLAVDSPGGEVFGASELSDMVFNARGTKPIVAHVSGFGASAAYWIASAADEVVTSSTGILGSLGVCMSVIVPGDEPDLFGDREIEFVSSQSPDKHLDPTSKAGREQHQAIVDKLAGVFVADAARNRGVAEATVLDRFGKGGTFIGTDAVAAGLADRVATFEATHAALIARTSRGGVLPFRPAAVEPANSATLLAQILEAVGLEGGIRYAARAHLTATASSIPAPIAAPLPPAPKAAIKEDPVMSDVKKTAAPDAGADQLANFKERLASISNLCAAAGFPEKAVEYTDGELSIDAIGVELFGLKKAANTPDTIEVPNADTKIRVGKDREAERPFAHLGEQLSAIAAAYAPNGVSIGGLPGGQVDKRLHKISAAVSGASTAVGGDGGWLIQKDFTVDLNKNAFESGALVSRCSQTEIGANSDGLEVVTINETSRATGSRWGGVRIYRVAEADSVTKSKPKIGKWESRLEDLMGVAYMTNRLLQDAPAMASVFSEAYTDEFAFVIDDEVFRGTGAGQCMGILNAPATVSVGKETGQDAATIVAENIMNMWARVLPRSKASPVGAWFVNTETSPQLQQMQIGTGVSGTLVYMAPGGLSGSPYGSIYGKPVVEIEHASALGTVGDISYLDLARYKLITKGGIEAADSIHVRFLYNERTFRWVTRVNGAPKDSSPITPYKGTSGKTLSSFVTLATRA